MSKLYYRYGAMNSGKSTSLLQVAHNYQERGQRVIIAKPTVDSKSPMVASRLKVYAPVDWELFPDSSPLKFLAITDGVVNCVLIDEAQFLSEEQVNEFFVIAVRKKIPVIAYGIRNDFRSKSFTGSARLLELAHSLEEMKTICRCGKKAVLNGRKLDGQYIQEGGTVAIDTVAAGVEYESLCGECYLLKVGHVGSFVDEDSVDFI